MTPLYLLPIGFVLGVAITYSPIARFARYIETVFHELGHAVVGILLGKKLKGFKLYADTSGMTVTMSNGYGIRGMLTHLAGYPSPIVFSVLIIIMNILGYGKETMMVLIGVSVYMFLFARNFFAIVPLAIVGGLAGISLYFDNELVTLLVSGFLSGLLIKLGIDSLKKLYKYRPQGSDASMLRDFVGGAERFWIGLMMVLSVTNSFLIPWGVVAILNSIKSIQLPF